MEQRICCDCGKEKTLGEFRFRPETGKHRPYCLECDKARKRAYYASNREAHYEAGKRWRERNIERARAYQREYQAENRDKVRDWHQAYREKRRKQEVVELKVAKQVLLDAGRKQCSKCGEVRLLTDFYRRGGKTRHLLQSHCRFCVAARMRLRSKVDGHRAGSRERIWRHVVFERDQGICGICGGTVDRESFHIDHIIPLSRGGEHSYANVQLAHPECNYAKRDLLLEEFEALRAAAA